MPPSWLAKHPSATTNQQNAFCLKSAEAEPCTSNPHWAFPRRIKPFRPSRGSLWSNHVETPSRASSALLSSKQPTEIILCPPQIPCYTSNNPMFIGSTTGKTIKIMQSHTRVLHITILYNVSIVTLQWWYEMCLIYLQYNKKVCSPHGEHTLKIWYGKYQLHDHVKHLTNLQLLLIRSVVCDVQSVGGCGLILVV